MSATLTKDSHKSLLKKIDKKASFSEQEALDQVKNVYKEAGVNAPSDADIKQALQACDKDKEDGKIGGKTVQKAIKHLAGWSKDKDKKDKKHKDDKEDKDKKHDKEDKDKKHDKEKKD